MRAPVLALDATMPDVMTHPEHLPRSQGWWNACKNCQRLGRGAYIQGGMAGLAAHFVVVHMDPPPEVVTTT